MQPFSCTSRIPPSGWSNTFCFFLQIQYWGELFLSLFSLDLNPTSFHGLLLLIPLDFTALEKQERLICLGFSFPRGPFIYCQLFDNQEMFCALTSTRTEFELGSQLPLPSAKELMFLNCGVGELLRVPGLQGDPTSPF